MFEKFSGLKINPMKSEATVYGWENGTMEKIPLSTLSGQRKLFLL